MYYKTQPAYWYAILIFFISFTSAYAFRHDKKNFAQKITERMDSNKQYLKIIGKNW